MRVALASVLLIAGCDRIFYLDRLPEPEHDARVDSLVDVSIDAPMDGWQVNGCPEGFTYEPRTGTSYRAGAPQAWLLARNACRGLVTSNGWHSHLVVINDHAEYAVVFDMFNIVNQSGWTGAYDFDTGDMASGFWYVTAQAPVAVRWGPSQPDAPDASNCARFWVPEGMDDENCASQLQAICECDQYADQ